MGWTVAVAIGGALAVWGKHPGRMWVHWIAKPATMLAVIAAALAQPSLLDPGARGALLGALALSLAGDVFLMLPRAPLVAGLASFLAAHLAYLAAFSLEVPWRLGQLAWLVPPAAAAAVLVAKLWRSFGRLRPAVLVYVAALAAVSWRLLARWDLVPEIGVRSFVLGATGGALFLLSDALLATRRFGHRAPPYALELGSYFAAQLLIVSATWRP